MKFRVKSVALLCAAVMLFSLCACSGEEMEEYYENSYDTGTDVISVHFAYDTMEEDEKGEKIYFTDSELEKIFTECCNIYADALRAVDHTDPSSILYEINQPVNAVFDVDAEIAELLDRALTIAGVTDGYYQPVFGSVTQLLKENPQPEQTLLDEALSHTGTDKITIEGTSVYKTDPLSQVDLTGLRNGYALEKIIAYLEESPVVYGFVTLGNSAGVFGTKPKEDPFEIGILADEDEASIEGYVHASTGYVFVASDAIGGAMDYSDGSPANSDLTKVAVMSEDAVAADALAHALYVMGYEAGQELYTSGEISFEAVFFLDDGTVEVTDGAYRAGIYDPTLGNMNT